MAQDEGRVGRLSRPTRCWAPLGVRPPAPAHVVREAVDVFAAVAPSLGKICSLILPTADTQMMNLFLLHVSQTFPDFFMVMHVDQASWHHSKTLLLPENIRLIKHPPYSPELNPVEHVWDDLREKHVHHRAFSSLDLLIDQLCSALNRFADDPQRITSRTNFPHLQIVF